MKTKDGKMKILIDEHESYPDYVIPTETGISGSERTCDVDEVSLFRWRKVIAEYRNVQAEMRDAYNKGESWGHEYTVQP